MYHVLACAKSHPTAVRPYQGLFNHRSLSALVDHCDVQLDAMVPVAKAPPIGPYSTYSDIPDSDGWGGYETNHPRFLYPLPKRIFKYTVAARSFTKAVTRHAHEQFDVPDVVHAGHIYFDGYGMLRYCRQHGLPLFVMGRGYTLNNYYQLPLAARRRVSETLEYCSGILCVSDALAETARQLTEPQKVSVLPNGANPDYFPTDHDQSIRNELNIPDHKTVALFVGSFTERKGIKEITNILPEIDTPDTTFIFVGHHGALRWELQRTLNRCSVDSQLYWKLSPLALRRLYAIADLVLLPSYAEGRPNVIYEAMASQTAVLATSIGGITEQVVDGETGVLIPPKSPAELKNNLVSMVADKTSLREMGQQGKNHLKQKGWSWKSHAETLGEYHMAALSDS